MAIKDSGDRTVFETGAVRDMRVGKGRCDLMPLALAQILIDADPKDLGPRNAGPLTHLEYFKESGFVVELRNAILAFHRESRYTSIYEMMLDVSHHFEEGCEKYGENNWQKGIPVHCYVDSAARHYLKWRRGDEDERHDRAFVWNVMCAWWTCGHIYEMHEYARKDDCDSTEAVYGA